MFLVLKYKVNYYEIIYKYMKLQAMKYNSLND